MMYAILFGTLPILNPPQIYCSFANDAEVNEFIQTRLEDWDPKTYGYFISPDFVYPDSIRELIDLECVDEFAVETCLRIRFQEYSSIALYESTV